MSQNQRITSVNGRTSIFSRVSGFIPTTPERNWEKVKEQTINWDVVDQRLFRKSLGINPDTGKPWVLASDRRALIRSDNDVELATVNKDYQVISNGTMFAHLDSTGIPYHSVTVRQGGAIIEATQQMQNPILIANEKHIVQIVARNGHGTVAFSLEMRLINMLCMNGLSVVLGEHFFKTRHTKNVHARVDEKADQLKNLPEKLAEMYAPIERLAKVSTNKEDIEAFFTQLFPQLKEKESKMNSVTELRIRRIMQEIKNAGTVHEENSGTLWQMMQGLTAALDHANEDADTVVYGSLANLKSKGVEILQTMANDGKHSFTSRKYQDSDIQLGRGLLAEIVR